MGDSGAWAAVSAPRRDVYLWESLSSWTAASCKAERILRDCTVEMNLPGGMAAFLVVEEPVLLDTFDFAAPYCSSDLPYNCIFPTPSSVPDSDATYSLSHSAKASTTVTNNEEDGENKDKGEKTSNKLPTPFATGPYSVLDVTAIVQAAVQAAVREVVRGMALLQAQAVASPVPCVGETARLVPSFNPLSLSCPTLDMWIRRIDDLADIYHWTDRMTSCNALTKLEGLARSWYDSLSSVDKTWTEWKEELRRAFP
ncbi:hypothetical protein HPB47_001887 [Ixodes persulcatus]|uniref:Uncharacterized protein n=1 Tax=Ixodes persulcatus TaxID=34615 RepID=A0AC60PP09_IXOPE|nr:hypothetical protein HPB47_001887 [Ixodes persulcatus]